ncbi:MAG: GNAT family N-acetyltransferase [bacterium]|nr:GNAT family N-acetyltransferase [bacterium]
MQSQNKEGNRRNRPSPLAGFPALSRTSEEARMALAMEFAKTRNETDPEAAAGFLSIAGGLAVYGGKDSPFNRVYGFGGSGDPIEDLARSESFYWPKLCPFEVEMSPRGDENIADLLESKKYYAKAPRLIWALPLEDTSGSVDFSAKRTIVEISPEQGKLWAQVMDQAYGQPIGWNAPQTFAAYTQMPSVKLYMALEEGRPIGGAALFLRGRTAILFSAAVLLEKRGEGYFSDLLRIRLEMARDWGSDLALVETLPSSPAIPILNSLGFTLLCELPQYSRTR